MAKTPARLLRPRPARTVAPNGIHFSTVARMERAESGMLGNRAVCEWSDFSPLRDSAHAAKPEQAIVCRACQGHVTTRDEAMLFFGNHIASLVVRPPGATHGIAFFKTAQVRLKDLRFFKPPASDELDSAHCRICDAQLGMRLITPDFRFYALFLDLISGV